MKYLSNTIAPRKSRLGGWYCKISGQSPIVETKALFGGRFANLLYACRVLKAEVRP